MNAQSRLLLVSLTALVGLAGLPAAWARPICSGALAVRINDKGLQFFAKQVRPLVPTAIDLPAFSKVVVDWPLTSSDAIVQSPGLKATVSLSDLRLQMSGSDLTLLGRADVTTSGPITVLNPYAGMGSADCQADVQLKDLAIDVGLRLDTLRGKVSAQVTRALISMDQQSSVVALKGCALGSALTAVISFLRKHFMGVIQSQLQSVARKKVPELVASKLGDTLQVSREVMGFAFTGQLESVATDSHGIHVTLGAGVGLKQAVAPACLSSVDLAPPASCVGVQASLASSRADAMFSAALSQALINQALHAVWRSGRLCISSDTLKIPTLSQGLGKLAAALGQPASSRLVLAIRLMAPPTVRLSAGQGLQLRLSKVLVKLTLTPPGGPENVVLLSTDLSVTAMPWIDPAGNGISLDLRGLSINKLELQGQGSTSLSLDPARLQHFIETVALPVVREQLAASPLSPGVISTKVVQLELKLVQIFDGYLAAHVDGYRLTATGDRSPPQTLLVQGPAAEVGPQVIQVRTSGSDNRTPAALLQYQARVDGGAWTQPTYGGRVSVVTSRGRHVVEVAAIDHDGNVDPSPLRMLLTVDDVPPQLLVTARPDPFVDGGEVTVSFDGRDDRTTASGLAFKVQLYRVPPGGGMPERVQEQSVPGGARSSSFTGLEDGVYKIRIIVSDAVGNVTSQDVGFVVDSTTGCTAASGAPLPPPSVALGLLLLALACRARSRHRHTPPA